MPRSAAAGWSDTPWRPRPDRPRPAHWRARRSARSSIRSIRRVRPARVVVRVPSGARTRSSPAGDAPRETRSIVHAICWMRLSVASHAASSGRAERPRSSVRRYGSIWSSGGRPAADASGTSVPATARDCSGVWGGRCRVHQRTNAPPPMASATAAAMSQGFQARRPEGPERRRVTPSRSRSRSSTGMAPAYTPATLSGMRSPHAGHQPEVCGRHPLHYRDLGLHYAVRRSTCVIAPGPASSLPFDGGAM